MKSDNKHMIDNFSERAFFDAINDEHKMAFRDSLNDVHYRKESQANKYVISIMSWKVQSIAASIAIFLLVGASFFFNMTNSTNENLFEQYYSTQNTILTVRSNTTEFSPVSDGMKYFDQQDYGKALNAFELAPENVIAKLYSGFAYMELKKYDEAIVAFEEIIEQKDNLFIDQAEWNLGLCYVITNNTGQAREVLTRITNSNTIYNIRAQQLLEDMGNN